LESKEANKANKSTNPQNIYNMSFSNVVLFTNYIKESVISDENTAFRNVDGVDLSSIIAHKANEVPVNEFISSIFQSNIINDEYFDIIIIYVINWLNYLKTKGVYLNLLTSHKLMYILIVLANKISDDEACNNRLWANTASITVSRINKMECAILQIFNYDLIVVISREKALAIHKTMC
jgi:hypothetical protein